jgi:hypothetical protein
VRSLCDGSENGRARQPQIPHFVRDDNCVLVGLSMSRRRVTDFKALTVFDREER